MRLRKRKKEMSDPEVIARLAMMVPDIRPVPDVDPERLAKAVYSRKSHKTKTQPREVRHLRSL